MPSNDQYASAFSPRERELPEIGEVLLLGQRGALGGITPDAAGFGGTHRRRAGRRREDRRGHREADARMASMAGAANMARRARFIARRYTTPA